MVALLALVVVIGVVVIGVVVVVVVVVAVVAVAVVKMGIKPLYIFLCDGRALCIPLFSLPRGGRESHSSIRYMLIRCKVK